MLAAVAELVFAFDESVFERDSVVEYEAFVFPEAFFFGDFFEVFEDSAFEVVDLIDA